ncbi:glutamate--tRNA ligase [Candidatus Woesearchaeota archaeon]|nr:glutamate--tRNA ligase [Candidatus Woesearchaeota archaeon]
MEQKVKDAILKYSLQNAVKFGGKANAGAVIGKMFAEEPKLKEHTKELAKEIQGIVSHVNQLGTEKQRKKLEEVAPELLEKKHEKHEADIFSHLDLGSRDIVTAFPPEPSKYPHIGHAKALLLNYELARRHNGRFVLRFEDTNPELAEEDFYGMHIEDYAWLGVKPDKIDYASDHMEKFYECAEKLIHDGNAYVCSCRQEDFKELRFRGAECPCRNGNDSMKKWQEMAKAKEGRLVLRLKGDMHSQNTTLRDPTLMRLVDKSHARTKKKYRLWPTYDFENAVMDGLEGITHRLRSKEFELRAELQNMMQSMLGLKQTRLYHFARFNLEGVESSGRIIRELIKKKKLTGWDDPSLTTLAALRRRGFLPEAIKEFVLSTGMTKTESVLTWDDLIAHNRRQLDPLCNRHFFVSNPKPIKITGAPMQDIELKLHPEFADRGVRKFSVKDEFYVTAEDFNEFRDGKLYRLMDCLNFRKNGNKLEFDSLDYENYRHKGDRIIHWLPKQKDLAKVEILMPDKKTAKGIAESGVNELKEGSIVQFARFGFCRLDKKEKSRLIFRYTHD